ncbi:MAG: sensor histidine kinase [Litoreibacter sp.]
MGEDWTASEDTVEAELADKRQARGFISLNRSPLARKIVTFNLLALVVLVAGVLFLNPFRDSLVAQHEAALISEAKLIAGMMAMDVSRDGKPDLASVTSGDALAGLVLSSDVEVFVFADVETLLASAGKIDLPADESTEDLTQNASNTVITDSLNAIWNGLSGVFGTQNSIRRSVPSEDEARSLVSDALTGQVQLRSRVDGILGHTFTVAAPVVVNGQPIGVVALASVSGHIDKLVRNEREQVLQMFVIAILVSIGLSLVLASTIANPLSDLAAAAELGRDKNARKVSPGRVRIPDLTARPDEIGRLSGAMRGMVAALYERIDANEQFAADVAHEIKNPLASLRSAVGTLRVAKTDEQRGRLLEVIEHDVRRLDRLVSDISNASRLDSELVKEDEEPFDLMHMINNLSEYLGQQAGEKGVEFIRDLPDEKIIIHGLEARLAQVFVNLITNATSFCEGGDAVRIWSRCRGNRVLVVVEDTGPGIPEQALNKVFKRFYSERPEQQFGNHSGLGLAISKQIIEAHGGVIWAENIRPTDADLTSEPLGARFVVGLPI